MTSFRHPLLPALLLVAAMLSGCATGTTYLEMSRTAGFVGARPTKVYVVNIEGTDAGSFQEELYEVLSKDRHFTIKPYGVTPPQSPDSATSVPSIILSGIHSTQEDTRYFYEGKEGDKKHYTETTESHEFQYSILDAVTGEELDANVVRQENVSKEEDNDGSIFDAVVEEVLEEVVKYLW